MLFTVVSFAYLIFFNTVLALAICLNATALKPIRSKMTKPKMHNFSVQNPVTFVVKNVVSCLLTHASKNAIKFNPTSTARRLKRENQRRL